MEQRIIKFKAKCIADGEWAKGYYFKKPSYKKTSNGDIVEDGEVYCIYGMTKDDVHPYWYEVDPSTVCQFTGLKDKNGKEIWEHDILKNYITHGEVVYEDGCFCVKTEWRDYRGYSLSELRGYCYSSRKNALKITNIGSKFDRKEEK